MNHDDILKEILSEVKSIRSELNSLQRCNEFNIRFNRLEEKIDRIDKNMSPDILTLLKSITKKMS